MVNHDLDIEIEFYMKKYHSGEYGKDKTHRALQMANWLKELKQYRIEHQNNLKKN